MLQCLRSQLLSFAELPVQDAGGMQQQTQAVGEKLVHAVRPAARSSRSPRQMAACRAAEWQRSSRPTGRRKSSAAGSTSNQRDGDGTPGAAGAARILAVIQVENQTLGRAGKAGNELLDEGLTETVDILAARRAGPRNGSAPLRIFLFVGRIQAGGQGNS
jgi:hypothetical protein